MKKLIFVLILLFATSSDLLAQSDQPDRNFNQPNNLQQMDALQNISQEITKISKSVQNFNNSIKDWLERFMVGKGMQLTERQQKLLLGFEVLNRAEQRLENFAKISNRVNPERGRSENSYGTTSGSVFT